MFVKALGKVIAQRVKLMNGICPRDAELHRRLAMRIFLASGSKRRFKKIVLLTLVNGDWRNQEDIEVYPEPGDTLLAAKKRLKAGLVSAFFGAKLAKWPRHRWRGQTSARTSWGFWSLSMVC